MTVAEHAGRESQRDTVVCECVWQWVDSFWPWQPGCLNGGFSFPCITDGDGDGCLMIGCHVSLYGMHFCWCWHSILWRCKCTPLFISQYCLCVTLRHCNLFWSFHVFCWLRECWAWAVVLHPFIYTSSKLALLPSTCNSPPVIGGIFAILTVE